MFIAMKAVSVLLATTALCGTGAGIAAAATPTGATTTPPPPYVLTIGNQGPMDVADLRNDVITIIPRSDGLLDVSLNRQSGLGGATLVDNESGQTVEVSITRQGTVLDRVALGAETRWHVSL
ncbi:hypothetical protein [Pseudonocardia sp. GCM10023141]|uniref:hypothetical protein n=1 Tax=Pseudonocardia sp. GCM10023141 TaxID=3252653 RepID=UPI00361EE1FD